MFGILVTRQSVANRRTKAYPAVGHTLRGMIVVVVLLHEQLLVVDRANEFR